MTVTAGIVDQAWRRVEPAELPDVDPSALRVGWVAEGRFFGWPLRERQSFTRPLSMFWTCEAFREKPSRVITFFALYVLGAIGYALVLPFRVMVFALNVLSLLYHFASRGYDGRFRRALTDFLGATGELASGVVGIACPPLAYWIDDKIEDYNPNSLEARIRQNVETIFPEPQGTRVIDKYEFLRPHLQTHFVSGVRKLEEYFHRDTVCGLDPRMMQQVIMLGFLYAFKGSLQSNRNAEFLDEMRVYLTTYLPNLDFGNHKENYLDQWRGLINQGNESASLIDSLILKAVQDAVDESDDAEYLPEQKDQLAQELEPTNGNQAFNALYEAMHGMINAIYTSDNDFFEIAAILSGISQPRRVD